MPSTSGWVLIEIITFYGLLCSVIIFLISSLVFNFAYTSQSRISMRNRKNAIDFLLQASKIYKSFGIICTLLIVSVTAFILEKDKVCSDNTTKR